MKVLVLPIIDHANALLGPLMQANMNTLARFQCRDVRSIFNPHNSTNSAKVLKAPATISSIQTRMNLNRTKSFYGLFKRSHEINVAKYIPLDSANTDHRSISRTKHGRHLQPNSSSLDIFKNLFFTRSIQDWSNRHHDNANMPNVPSFATALTPL